MLIVSKFGGTSAKDGQTLEHVIDNIILDNPERRVVVFSAPGKRNSSDIKVTDLLIQIGESQYAGKSPAEDFELLRRRFIGIIDYFGIGSEFLDAQFAPLEQAVRNVHRDKRAYLDGLMPYGEIINSEIVAEALRGRGVNARVYRPENIGMVTDGVFGSARVLDSSYEEISRNLLPALRGDELIVIPGFYGIDSNGNFVTFSRGGSDLTASIVANAVNADMCENWTDVDGIRRADPNIVDNSGFIKKLTFREARELAYSGAQVLHPATIIPLERKNIPLNVRNTFNLQHEGTYIAIAGGEEINGNVIKGIAHKEGFAIVYLEKTGMNDEIGYIGALAKLFNDRGLSFDQLTTGVDSVSIAVPYNGDRGKVGEILDKIVEGAIQLGLVDNPSDIRVDYDRALVCVVGKGMRSNPGAFKNIADALGSHKVNIELISKASERSIIIGVHQNDVNCAVNAIYDFSFRRHPPIY